MSVLREQRREETRKRLYEAALDVFRRENRYFDALAAQSPNADATAAEATDAGGPEK